MDTWAVISIKCISNDFNFVLSMQTYFVWRIHFKYSLIKYLTPEQLDIILIERVSIKRSIIISSVPRQGEVETC